MALNSQEPPDIYWRFQRTLPTDYQPTARQYFVKVSDLVPLVETGCGDILTAYEVFLLAGLLQNIREIRALKERLEYLTRESNISDP